jgi:hypothetical protein
MPASEVAKELRCLFCETATGVWEIGAVIVAGNVERPQG